MRLMGGAEWGRNVGNLVSMSDLLSTVFLAHTFFCCCKALRNQQGRIKICHLFGRFRINRAGSNILHEMKGSNLQPCPVV